MLVEVPEPGTLQKRAGISEEYPVGCNAWNALNVVAGETGLRSLRTDAKRNVSQCAAPVPHKSQRIAPPRTPLAQHAFLAE
jgi:hypothetical protein